MSALSEFALGTMRGRSQLRRFRRRFAYLAETVVVAACGFCGTPKADDRLDTHLVTPADSLLAVLARRRDDRYGMGVVAKRTRRKLRARRHRPAGSLCLYCYTRFAHGRDAAEALGRSGKWGAS